VLPLLSQHLSDEEQVRIRLTRAFFNPH
jgi:hypothetical protein